MTVFGTYFRFGATIVAASIWVSGAYSQTHNVEVSDDRIVIYVVDARPLSAVLQLLSTVHPFELTYEDPPFVYEGDISDITIAVRSDLHLYEDASEAPRILVPRSHALSVYVPISIDTATEDDWVAVLQSAVDAQATSGNGGRYKIEQSFETYHVIPVASRDPSGALAPRTPVLDTLITIPAEEMNGLAMLTKICEAVSEAVTGRHSYDPETILSNFLKPRALPTGMLGRYTGVLVARNERARDVIMRVLNSIDEEASWQVFVTFDPRYDNYWISVRSIYNQAAAAPASERRQRDVQASVFLSPERKRQLKSVDSTESPDTVESRPDLTP